MSIATETLKKKMAVDGWLIELEVDGKNIKPDRKDFSGKVVSFYFDSENLRMDGIFEYIGSRLILDFTLENNGSVPLIMGKVYPFTAHNISDWLPGDDIVVLASESHQTPRLVTRLDSPEALRTGKIKLQFFNRTKEQAFQAGFLGFRKQDTEVSYEYDNTRGIRNLKACCNFSGWKLAPGEKVRLETFTLVFGKDPHAQLVEWAELIAKKYSPQFISKPSLGWLGWSWVDCYNGKENHEHATMANLDAINQRLKGYGIDYLWLSIANISGGMPGNWLNWNKDNFPSPPKQLVHKLKEKGFKLGLWCAPFYISSALKELVDEFYDALLKKADGSLVVAAKKMAAWRCWASAGGRLAEDICT